MAGRDHERLNPFIDRKLSRVVRSSPAIPTWHEPWSRLGPQSTGEERLKVRQAIRDSGDIPDDAGYFLVCQGAEELTDAIEAKLQDPLQSLNVFEARRTSDRILAVLLEQHGEGGMATLVRSDPKEHDCRREAGRLFFFKPLKSEGSEIPGWLASLLRRVADSISASRPVETLEYWHRRDDDASAVGEET